MAKREQTSKPTPKMWRALLIKGKRAETLGIVYGPNRGAAEADAIERFGLTGEQRKRLALQERL